MNTTPQPQSPFVPVSPPSSTAPAVERPRRAKKAKAAKKPRRVGKEPALAAGYGAQAAAQAPKKPRKARATKKAAPVKRSLDINAIVSATVGLKADDARVMLKIHAMLGEHSGKSKAAIVGALGKLVG